MRKPVFWVSEHDLHKLSVRHKVSCTATENGYRPEIWDAEELNYLCSKTKMLICAFVFVYMQKTGFLMTRLNLLKLMNDYRDSTDPQHAQNCSESKGPL